MLEKIISGGQTGSDRAAIDFAIDHGIPHGGGCISATMRYNLACDECQLSNLERTKQWPEKAFALGDAKQMKLGALDDPDLQPLWKEIGKTR